MKMFSFVFNKKTDSKCLHDGHYSSDTVLQLKCWQYKFHKSISSAHGYSRWKSAASFLQESDGRWRMSIGSG